MSDHNEQRLPWIKRPDLQIARHDGGSWVVKDPLALTYVWLDDLEHSVLLQLDGRCTFSQLLNHVRRISNDASLTAEELSGFLRNLAAHQLVRLTEVGIFDPSAGKARQPAWLWILKSVLSLLRIRVRLLNPSSIIDSVLPLLRPFIRPAVAWMTSGLVLFASGLIVLRFGELTAALPSLSTFLRPGNLALMLCVFVVVKALHEAGHAFTSRYFGAECSECGVMMLMFAPVLYTNVTDVWTLPRRQRMLVTAAGIAVEIIIAAVCTVLWWFALPGTIKALLLNTMVVCSVNTIMFNGNPLLRFDGYFLLSDAVGIPNLSQQSAAAVKATALRWLSAADSNVADYPVRRRGLLLSYGLLSLAYRALLTFFIVRLVHEVGQVWNLQIIALAANACILSGFILLPLLSAIGSLASSQRESSAGWRIWSRAGICLLAVAAVLFIRLPHSVTAPAIVKPVGQSLYVQIPGALQSDVDYGVALRTGDQVAALTNGNLERRRETLLSEVTQLQLRLDLLLNDPLSTNSDLIPGVRESLASAQAQLDRFTDEYRELTISAPSAGTLQPPRATPGVPSADLPEVWSGLPLNPRNRSAWLERGTLLGTIGDPHVVSIVACVPESRMQYLRVGQTVEFLSLCSGIPPQTGVIESIAGLPTDEVSPELVLSGLQTGQMVAGTMTPATPLFEITVQPDSAQGSPQLPLYSVGQVRIHADHVSLFKRWSRSIQQTFSPSGSR